MDNVGPESVVVVTSVVVSVGEAVVVVDLSLIHISEPTRRA